MRWQRVLKWLYPGMGVKRWALLIGAGALLLVIGLIGLIGRARLKTLYDFFAASDFYTYLTIVVLTLVGLIAIGLGVNQLVRSIIREIRPEAEGRASELIYDRRLLRRGPQLCALGGGTGLSTLLRGLKEYTSNISAIVTVMDSGGSSGRLRRELGMLPPGDIRNNLIALAADESKIAELFDYRFGDGRGQLSGHSLGNLVLAGMQELRGSFEQAVVEMSQILNIRGQVLPATLENVELCAEMDDGSQVCGEAQIPTMSKRIKRLWLSQPHVAPSPRVLEEIRQAELIILGPGSLYTSLIPNLLVEGISREIAAAPALKLYIANLMTQPGETDGLSLMDHLKALEPYFDLRGLDLVLVNSGPIPEPILRRYRQEGSEPVLRDLSSKNPFGLRVIAADLIEPVRQTEESGRSKLTVKHSPQKLARAIVSCAPQLFEGHHWKRRSH
ncbi:MAG TPA: YvcK family protein [Candidatus Fraserbacteria bacterium]|nr:YvcK family protein [Candidatus Fraserbacteria bacterium]